MATGRCLLLATVTAVKDTSVCYQCCTQCYSKLLLDTADGSFWCGKCHSGYDEQEVPQRYRLSLVIADSSNLAHVTVFGGALQPFFGTTAFSFKRHIHCVESKALPCDSSDILSKALDATFVGKQFWFGFSKGVGSSQAPRQVVAPCLATLTSKLALADGTNKPDSTMVASQMIRAGNGPFSTVMDNFNSLLESENGVKNLDVSLEQEVSTMSFHDGKQDFRLSNTSVFFKCTGNTSVSLCMSSNTCYNSCLLSCDREQGLTERLSEACASYNSYVPDNSVSESLCVLGIMNPSENTGNDPLLRKSLYSTNAPMRSYRIVDCEKSEKVIPSKGTGHILPLYMCHGEALFPCDDQDQTLPPTGDENESLSPHLDHNQTLPTTDDGNTRLAVGGDREETLPSGENVTKAAVNVHCKTSPQCGDEDDAPSLLHSPDHTCSSDNMVLDIEMVRNRSTSTTRESRSSTFDDSSFLLECDRMETTTDSYPVPSQKENKVTQQRKGNKISTTQQCPITVDKALLKLSHASLVPELLELTACESPPQGEMAKDVRTRTNSRSDICKSSTLSKGAHFKRDNEQMCRSGNEPVVNCVSDCVDELPKYLEQVLGFEDDLWEDWSTDRDVDDVTTQSQPCEVYQKTGICTTSFLGKPGGTMTEDPFGICKSDGNIFVGRGTHENVLANVWEELPESEDLAAFLGDYSTSMNFDNSCAETNSESSSDVHRSPQRTSSVDHNSRSSIMKDLNGSSDLEDEGLPVTSVRCVSHGSVVFCQRQDVQSNGDNQEYWGCTIPNSENKAVGTDSKHISKISVPVCETSVSRTDWENSPHHELHYLSAEESSFDLFDSFQSLPRVMESDVQFDGKKSSQHIILESQISSSPINGNQITSPDALQEHCKDIPKSVKFSRRLSAVSNVRLMDIRMKVAPNPAIRERKIPRSCLKRQSDLSIKKENLHPKGRSLKPLYNDFAELPRQSLTVLPQSEDLFTPSPITFREAQHSLKRQIAACGSVRDAQSGTSGFTQSTPLLFSQCNGSLRKSITTYYLKGQLSNVDLSMDLFASPDLFSQTEMHHPRPSTTASLLSANLHASQLGHKSVPRRKNATGHEVIKTSHDNNKHDVLEKICSSHLDDSAHSSTSYVRSNISTCSTDLFSPDVLGSSLLSQEWKEPLRKNLFF